MLLYLAFVKTFSVFFPSFAETAALRGANHKVVPFVCVDQKHFFLWCFNAISVRKFQMSINWNLFNFRPHSDNNETSSALRRIAPYFQFIGQNYSTVELWHGHPNVQTGNWRGDSGDGTAKQPFAVLPLPPSFENMEPQSISQPFYHSKLAHKEMGKS